MNFLEKLLHNVQQNPEKLALKDNLQAAGVSYQRLDILSGRVLAYLQKKGIGKEDFVAICLPRGVDPLIAIIGVVKAGAAFVIIEENYAPERATLIKKDCNCKLVIDHDVWQEIQYEESSQAFADWDDHAALFAIYTSGSTGTPKGVVHEYGNIENMVLSLCNKVMNGVATDRMALIAPLTFVPSMIAMFAILSLCATFYVVPYAVVKSPKELQLYLSDSCATIAFLPPAIIRLLPKFSPHFRLILTGGELITQTYREDIQIINCYATSECGLVACCFSVDKPYNITPVGKSAFPLDVRILDECGKPVPDGESGEICIHVPFVRGYLNRPEENKKTFGEGRIYRTNDIAHRQPDGNYVIHGRIDDMIKIHGNRVEPGEIAAVVKQVLKIDLAIVKGFSEGNSQFICVYYTQDIKIDYDKTRKELQKHLPYYMLPSYFIKLDAIPLNPNGKLDRNALKPPVQEDYRSEYVAPTNAFEMQLCAAFAQALQLDRIGIHDDFHLLGGDSLGAMTVLTLCNIKSLTIGAIFHGRTPEKIALICSEFTADISYEDAKKTLSKEFPLSSEQLYMLDYQLHAPKSTMYNLHLFVKLGSDIDVSRFSVAVSETIKRHDALLTVFGFDEDGEMIQHCDPALAKPIPVEQVSEAELAILKDSLIQPFKIVGNQLYRCRIFKTEVAAYIFFDVHHTIFDGTSFGILLADIDAFYSGELHRLQEDFYYTLLAKQMQIKNAPAYQQSLHYFKDRYENQTFAMLEPFANKTRENRIDRMDVFLPKMQDLLIQTASKQHSVSNNVLFLAVTALVLARYCQKPYAEFAWIYNGRDSAEQLSTVGLMYNMLPIDVNLPMNRKFSEVLEDIGEQVMLAIRHGNIHYISSKMRSQQDFGTCMIYQDQLRCLEVICGEKVEFISLENHYQAAQSALDIEIMQNNNATQVMFNFNSAMFDRSLMETLLRDYQCIATTLLESVHLDTLTVENIMNACDGTPN